MGMGWWTRNNAEVCLVATKGHPKRISRKVHQLIISPVEEHSKIGGLGAAIAEVVSEETGFPRLIRLGIEDTFDLAGDYEGLLVQNRLTAPLIAEDIISELNKG